MCKMWAEKWESWQLRRQRQRLENAYRPPAGATPDELLSLSSERSMELQPVQRRLWEIQTAELRRCADRWAIDVEAKWDDSGRATGHAFFSSRDRHDLERKIRRERREFWRFLAATIVPLLSLVVALAAILFR